MPPDQQADTKGENLSLKAYNEAEAALAEGDSIKGLAKALILHALITENAARLIASAVGGPTATEAKSEGKPEG